MLCMGVWVVHLLHCMVSYHQHVPIHHVPCAALIPPPPKKRHTHTHTKKHTQKQGHAFEGRLYAETPHNDFLPATGTVARWSLPPPTSTFEFTTGPGTNQIRVDSGVQQGDQVGVYYDPMIAKVLVTGPDRPTALQNLCAALSEMMVAGLPTNQDFMLRVAQHPAFQAGGVNTSFIVQHKEELMHTPVPSGVTVALAWLVGHAVALKKYTVCW